MRKNYLILLLLLFSSMAFTQAVLTGTITDQNGEPLPGANVSLKGTNNSNITDADGFFMFKELENGSYTLVASYIGFGNYEKEISINGITDVNVEMAAATYNTSQVIVSANRVAADAPITHTTLGKEEIDANNLGQDVPFLLRWTPSMVVTSDAGTGIGYTGIRLRGSDPTRINVTINGIPLNDSESQGVFWVDLPDFATSTQEVQIQRGVGTSTNGAGAFGGTINLSTVTKKEKAYGQIDATYGSFNTLKGNIQLGSGLINNRFTLDGRISHIESDGYIDRATADLNSFQASAAYWGDKNSIIFNVFGGHEVTYQAWNGVPAQYIDNDSLRTTNTAGAERPGEPYENEVDDYTQVHYQLLYNQSLGSSWYWRSALHYTKGKGFFEQYKAGEELADYGFDQGESDLVRRRWLDNDFYGLTTSLNYQKSNLDLTVGGAANNYLGGHFGETIWAETLGDIENSPRYYDNDAEKLDINVFAKANYKFNSSFSGFLDLQYRHINYDFLGVNNDGSPLDQDDQLNFFNPKVGLAYKVYDQGQIYAFAGVAQREPNRNDYTENPLNTRPLPEFMIDYELGFKHQSKKTYFGANLYFMDYTDQLVVTGLLNDVGEYTRVNVADSYRAGIELDVQTMLTNRFSVNANLTLSQNKVKEFTEYIDNWDTWGQETVVHENTDLALSPNTIFGGNLSYAFVQNDNHNLTASLLGKYLGKQFIDNTSNENTVLDAYFFSDLRLAYAWQTNGGFFKGVEATFLLRNIFDSKFSTNAWTYRYISEGYDGRPDDPYTRLENGATYNLTGFYPQAGRNFLLGVSLKF